jgi:hypothetical protein
MSQNSHENPYAAPPLPANNPDSNALPKGVTRFAPCPKCQCEFAKKISWTLWGGALGPALFNHVACFQCQTTYNGKTGKSNNTAITIYVVVSFVIAIVIGVALLLLQ